MGKLIIQEYSFVKLESDFNYFEENYEFDYNLFKNLRVLALSPNFKTLGNIERKIFPTEFISFISNNIKIKEIILHDYNDSPVDSYYSINIDKLNFKRLGLNGGSVYQKFNKKFKQIIIYLMDSDCFDIKALCYLEKENFDSLIFFGAKYWPFGTTDEDYIFLIENNIRGKNFKNVSYYSSSNNLVTNF